MKLDTFLNDQLISLDVTMANSREAIEDLGTACTLNGYTKPEYTEAVIAREKKFPTGMQLPNVGIAIPHAAPEGNVAKDGIAILRLTDPVEFRSMDDPEQVVQAKLIFYLALHEANQHLSVLQKLFQLFQRQELIDALLSAKDAKEFRNLLAENLSLK